MGIVVSLYALFSFSVVGATGPATTPIAFDGLLPLLGNTFGFVVSFIGSLITFSIFMMIGVELKHLYRYDFSLPNLGAWALTVIPPMLLYLMGIREFVAVIGFVGAIFGGVLGMMSVWIYECMRRKLSCDHHYCFRIPSWISLLLILVFFSGMVLEIASLAH
jgi:hypothetical protein